MEPGRVVVHVAERADVLADRLGDLLATPLADPFTTEVVAVPTPGAGRWVAQRLSHRLGAGPTEDGIAAGIRFDPPWRLVADVLAATVGVDRHDDPWHPGRLTWHVLAAVDQHLDDPWMAAVRRHLGDDPADEVRRGRRVRVARQVARLFTDYDTHRPALLAAWAERRHADEHDADGRDTDGAGRPLPDDLRWQAALWRAVSDRLDVPTPSQRITDATDRLRTDPEAVDLPERLSVFAPASLPEAHLRVLAALAEHREVHLWLPHPSAALWHRVADQVDALPAPVGLARAEMPRLARHRLLATLAGASTELQLRLLPHAATVDVHPAPPRPGTVLGTVQQAVADDRPEAPRATMSTADRSVQVHACHGRTRQVEVLRDVLTRVLADDPTLEPRDVVVLCPDVSGLAPLVAAVFDPVETDDDATHPGRGLRVRVADDGPSQVNPLLAVLSTVLGLASSRVTASAVLDLAAAAPVRHRFGLDDDDLERLRDWTAESGVRWGEGAARRARYKVSQAQGTWAAGTDRLLLGVAMAEEEQRFCGPVLPVDDVASSDVDLVGRWAELLDRLTGVLADLSGTHPAAHWLDTAERALRLLTDTPPQERRQQAEAARALARVREHMADPSAPLRLADAVALLAPALTGRRARSGCRTGALTVCSLSALRAVPHRVVALLGVDDDVFPRHGGHDGDDVLARDPRVGEPEPRTDDHQLFLDAVTSATQTLVVVCSGADERTGARRALAGPVAALLDAVDDAVRLHHPDGTPAAASDLVTHHPLQPVDPRAFDHEDPFSFDRSDLAAARALTADPPQPRPFLVSALPREPDGDIELVGLVGALQHPVKAFVRDRLGLIAPGEVDLVDDRLPLEADRLTRWAAGERILHATLSGVSLAQAGDAERRRGHLPPAELGGRATAEVLDAVSALERAASPYLADPARSVAVTVDLPGGRRLTGAVEMRGTQVVTATFSRLAPKHRLKAWLELLAVAADGSVSVHGAVTVGQGWRTVGLSRLRAPDRDQARAVLAGLVGLYDEAMTEPLPLPLGPSWDYARARLRGRSSRVATQQAASALERANKFPNPYDTLVWGGPADLGTLLAAGPTPADARRAPDEGTRFGALAVALWGDLAAHEEMTG
ncbi:MAG: exodeoxyribonuclease V subunit gamma [Micrococcales bacterium]|nr:exodeoxyribonuclease V subunit gamma [Micrococcales bacterium]